MGLYGGLFSLFIHQCGKVYTDVLIMYINIQDVDKSYKK